MPNNIGYDRRTLADEGTPSGTVTDATEYLGPFYNYGFNHMRLVVVRESEVGTATMAIDLEFQDPVSGDWTDLLDHAGTKISFVTWADAATGMRTLEIGYGATGGADADGVLVYGTNYKAYDVFLPGAMRLEVIHGGTSISNVYHAYVEGY